ncbi:MAG: hypothetical protein ACREAS_04335 [Nitrososphaera sp.]|jgi:hypothetical protein
MAIAEEEERQDHNDSNKRKWKSQVGLAVADTETIQRTFRKLRSWVDPSCPYFPL